MAEDQEPQSQPDAASQPEAAAGQPADPGGPGDTTQATGQNPVEVGKENLEEAQKAAEDPTPAAATDGPDGPSPEDVEKIEDDAEMARKAMEAQQAPNLDFENRLLDRQARRDGEDAVEALKSTNQKLREDSAAAQAAADAAAARTTWWVGPEPVDGRTDEVKIALHPEDPAERVATIHVRVLGEVNDGFVTVYRDNADPDEVKEGRVAESPRFGTKNRVYAKGVNPKTQLAEGEETHLGYFDFGPLRLDPGDYTAVVATTGGDELDRAKFTITGVSAEDLSEKNSDGPTGAQRAVIQAAQAARATERQNALKNGTKLPDPLSEEDVLKDLVGSGKKK